MTKRTRRKFSADFKAKVALEAIKNQKTLAQLSQQYDVNAITIAKWKSEVLENLSSVFKGKQEEERPENTVEIDRLYAQIGQLKVENDFLKKKCQEIGDTRQRAEMVNPHYTKLSVRKQCEVLSVPRSSLYYAPVPEKPENVKMMNLMDRHLLLHPTEGVFVYG